MLDRMDRARRVTEALGALFRETRIPVIVVEASGSLVTANAATVARYGWSLEELVTMGLQDLQAQWRPEIPSELQRVLERASPPLPRRAHRKKDGTVIWVAPMAEPIVVDGERLVISLLQEVTELVEAEERAREATAAGLRDRQLVFNAVVGMLGEGDVRPALGVLARSFGEAIRRAATVWVPERKGGRVLHAVAWHDLSDEGLRQLPTKRIDLDSERFARLAWDTGLGYEVRAPELAPGSTEFATVSRLGPGVVAPLLGREGPHGLLYGIPAEGEDFARAVTLATTLGSFGGMVLEAVKLEARADIVWRAASEQLSDGIALLDADLRVVRVNTAESSLLGIDEAHMVGRRCSDLFPTCKTAERCPHRVALEERRRCVFEVTTHLAHKPLRVEVIPAQDNDAQIAVIHVAHDQSEERATRTQLMTSDRLASIGRLAAGVAHEINNPAAFVTVNLGVLRDRFRAGNARSQDVLAMLDESLNGMDRIQGIVRDLKGLARDRAADVVDLAALVQAAIRMTAHETRGRARVERVAEGAALARARGARIMQVVLNLILNAAQALPPGRADNRLTVATRREGDRALVEVADNGSGIDHAIGARVFEPFFTTREGTGGTGLGLWLARSIVEEEGGMLTFSDEPGGGTRFVVDLPAAQPEAPGREATMAAEP